MFRSQVLKKKKWGGEEGSKREVLEAEMRGWRGPAAGTDLRGRRGRSAHAPQLSPAHSRCSPASSDPRWPHRAASSSFWLPAPSACLAVVRGVAGLWAFIFSCAGKLGQKIKILIEPVSGCAAHY